jgi:hypothetical protein
VVHTFNFYFRELHRASGLRTFGANCCATSYTGDACATSDRLGENPGRRVNLCRNPEIP